MAQVNNNALRAMAYAEAQKQGVNPQALEQRLIDRGIDVNTLKMEDIAELEPIVKEEIAALKTLLKVHCQQKNRPNQNPKTAPKLTGELRLPMSKTLRRADVIQVKVEYGKTVFGKSILKWFFKSF